MKNTDNEKERYNENIREKEGRKEGNVLFKDTLNILFTVIWRQTYG